MIHKPKIAFQAARLLPSTGWDVPTRTARLEVRLSLLDAADSQFRSALYAELGEQRVNVKLYGVDADAELLGDSLIRQTFADEF